VKYKWFQNIQEKTSGMTKREKLDYIWTYYWYHILGAVVIIALIFLFAWHYAFGNKKPVFTCIVVNRESEMNQVGEMARAFAKESGLPAEQVVFLADYMFSYGDVHLEGINESTYEKFFFQWRNKEIDAVILPESFYWHVKEMGGTFRKLDENMTEGFTPYMDERKCTAVVLGDGSSCEKVLLAFPETGQHFEECRGFLTFLRLWSTGEEHLDQNRNL